MIIMIIIIYRFFVFAVCDRKIRLPMWNERCPFHDNFSSESALIQGRWTKIHKQVSPDQVGKAD